MHQVRKMLLDGRSPEEMSTPVWRAHVSYLPQSRTTGLKGTPAEVYFQASSMRRQGLRFS